MKVTCKHCGQVTEVNGLGRKPKAMPVTNVCDIVKSKGSVRAAAVELGCSRAYIYKVLKANGLKPGEVIKKPKSGGES